MVLKIVLKIVKLGNHPRCPLINDQIMKIKYVGPMGYFKP